MCVPDFFLYVCVLSFVSLYAYMCVYKCASMCLNVCVCV